MGDLGREIRRIVREELRAAMHAARRGTIQSHEVEQKLPAAQVEGYQGASTAEQMAVGVVEPYGHASRPPAQTPGVLLKVGGQWVMVGCEDRTYRPDLEDGEAALYGQGGATAKTKTTGDLELNGGATGVAADGDSCTFTLTAGPYTVTGTIQIGTAGRSVKV